MDDMKPLHWEEVAARRAESELPFLKYFRAGLPERPPREESNVARDQPSPQLAKPERRP